MNSLSIILLIIIIFIFIIIYYKNYYKKENLNIKPPFKIDAVITFVDMNDPIYHNLIKQNNLARFDNNNEILYCFRSIEKNLNFLNKIYLILADDHQIPSFLIKKHFQIEIIYHSDFIPKQYLPTYNSTVIENYIHKIKNLSEHFLYLNDDLVILKPQKWYHFFTPKGLPIYSVDRISNICDSKYWKIKDNDLSINKELIKIPYKFTKLISQNNCLLNIIMKCQTKRTLVQHIPQPIRKSFMNELDNFLNSYYVNNESLLTFGNQFKYRNNYNLAKISIINKYFCLYYKKCIEKQFSLFNLYINSNNDLTNKIYDILESNNDFLNISNDGNEKTSIYLKNYRILNRVLNILFPLKSSFEN
jgi:hypothetical protein